MYGFQQIQSHLNRLHQDLNNVCQVTAQLQQVEQQTQSQLARISQQEGQNSQNLQRVYQICMNLQNDVSAVSAATQQIGAAIPSFGTGVGQFATTGYTGVGAGQLGAAGYTAGVNTPYTGFASTSQNLPYTGYSSSAGMPYNTFTPNIANTPYTGLTARSSEGLPPTFNLNFTTPGATASNVHGGLYANRPWPDSDRPGQAQNIGISPYAGVYGFRQDT
ncbi:MAG: hypothetical protein AB1500_03580 [Bacillota bacterium]